LGNLSSVYTKDQTGNIRKNRFVVPDFHHQSVEKFDTDWLFCSGILALSISSIDFIAGILIWVKVTKITT